MADSNEIVGHKTISDRQGGHRHEPLTRGEADALWSAVEASKKARADAMPTEEDAVRVMWSAYQRLKELGWKDASYLSSESYGTVRLIEPGSTGIHQGHYIGEWPKGSWWIHDEGNLWPSRPCLARITNATNKENGE